MPISSGRIDRSVDGEALRGLAGGLGGGIRARAAMAATVAGLHEAIAPSARDLLLRVVTRPRELLPGIDLTFPDSRRYDSSREVASFWGEALGHPVQCAVSREALEDHLGANGKDKEGRLASFHLGRSKIERLAKVKYLSWPVEEPETVLLKTEDVEQLRKIP